MTTLGAHIKSYSCSIQKNNLGIKAEKHCGIIRKASSDREGGGLYISHCISSYLMISTIAQLIRTWTLSSFFNNLSFIMKITSKAVSLLSVAAAVNAAAQCPMDWDNPADEYGNPGYVDLDFYFNGTGKLHVHSGCTYWRQNYPRDITRDSIGCLDDVGRVVPIDGDNCATWHYVGNTDELEDYEVMVFRNVKNNYICGWDFATDTGKWSCVDEDNQSDTWAPQWLDAPVRYWP